MSKWLKTNRLTLIVVGFFVGFYFLTRLINLTLVPIFTDEAIYIRWSQIGLQDAAWRFIPLTDGKPPLYHWFMMLVMATNLIADPLVEGRLVSVFSGFANLILIMILAEAMFRNRKVSLLTGLLYLLSPFMVVYDRLAVVDSLLTTTSLACLLFAVLLIKYRRFDVAIMFGVSVGSAMLTKASGLIFLLMSPATLLLIAWKEKAWIRKVVHWSGLLLIAAVISQLIYSILRLSQFFFRIEQKNHEFILTLPEFLAEPFSLTWGNLSTLIQWQIGYLTWPIFALVLVALIRKDYWREKLILLGYVAAPMFMIASFNKIIFPRFLLFSTPFLLILAAWGLLELLKTPKNLYIKIFLTLILLSSPATISYNWIVNPAQASIPQADRDQYYDSWPAGHGIDVTVAFLEAVAAQEPIFVGTQGTFGLMPYSLEIYLANNPNVEIRSYWPVEQIPDEVSQMATTKKTFFIYNELQEIPPQENLELIMEFEKRRLDEVRHMRLFQVMSE